MCTVVLYAACIYSSTVSDGTVSTVRMYCVLRLYATVQYVMISNAQGHTVIHRIIAVQIQQTLLFDTVPR